MPHESTVTTIQLEYAFVAVARGIQKIAGSTIHSVGLKVSQSC